VKQGGLMKAYVLIQTEVGKAGQVADEIKKIGGVVSAENVTGVYDIIALVQSDSVDELGKKVVKEIQLVQGITRTLTCPIVNL
jgi:DNA-binding Lrp family transcriptional regulator